MNYEDIQDNLDKGLLTQEEAERLEREKRWIECTVKTQKFTEEQINKTLGL